MGEFKYELRKNCQGNFELTTDELKDLILKSYNDGHNDGYNACKLKLQNLLTSYGNPGFCCTAQWLEEQRINKRSILDEI